MGKYGGRKYLFRFQRLPFLVLPERCGRRTESDYAKGGYRRD
jgi:hypothetical protein